VRWAIFSRDCLHLKENRNLGYKSIILGIESPNTVIRVEEAPPLNVRKGSERGAKPLFFHKGGGWEKIDWGWGLHYQTGDYQRVHTLDNKIAVVYNVRQSLR
jgi:hypothetical protein